MCSKMKITKSTKNYSACPQIKELLNECDSVLIGAGAGLSVSEGFSYSGKRFEKYFSDFKNKYGFSDMYSGGFYPYKTLEEYWAYWSRYIFVNRFNESEKGNGVYKKLFELVNKKDYFVITTNVDHQFQKAGFDKSRLFYTQGDFGLFQCSVPCHKKTYDNEKQILQMVEQQKDLKIPSELIPKCPVCGKPMTMNLRVDNSFVEDSFWEKAAARYSTFIEKHQNKKILFLELGVGFNTPGIIKYPFWQMTLQNPESHYVSINKGESYCPTEIQNRSFCIDEDIGKVLERL